MFGEPPLFRCTSLFFNPLHTSRDGDWHRAIHVWVHGERNGIPYLLLNLTGIFSSIFGIDTAALLTVLAGYRTFYNAIHGLLEKTISADLAGNAALGDANKQIKDLPVMKSLPKGVRVSPSGDAESLNELSEGFATAMTAGLMMVYAVLVLLFGTFLQPITILFSLPLSIGGAIGALLLTGKQLTTPVWIGILMLMGIVTKNAIMLVEFALESIRDGKSREEAIVDAGQKRARPIVMTTIAMVAGMMPSALAFGDGGEFRSPMALAVIGGLIFSTVLSLIFVPAVFMMMDDVARAFWKAGKMVLSHHHDAAAAETKPAAPAPKAAPAPSAAAAPQPARGYSFWRSK